MHRFAYSTHPPPRCSVALFSKMLWPTVQQSPKPHTNQHNSPGGALRALYCLHPHCKHGTGWGGVKTVRGWDLERRPTESDKACIARITKTVKQHEKSEYHSCCNESEDRFCSVGRRLHIASELRKAAGQLSERTILETPVLRVLDHLEEKIPRWRAGSEAASRTASSALSQHKKRRTSSGKTSSVRCI